MNKIYAGILALVLAVVGLVAFATIGSAHTPSVSPSCSGIVVSLTSYGEADVTVVVNGVSDSFHVSGNGGNTYAVPQDGTSSTWSVTIDETRDGDQYDYSNSGTVGPCGTTPTPTPTPTVPTPTPTVPTPTVPTETPTNPVTPEPPVVTPEPPTETPEPPTTPPVEVETKHVYTCTSHTVITYENGVEVGRDTNTFASTCDKGSNVPNPSEEGL